MSTSSISSGDCAAQVNLGSLSKVVLCFFFFEEIKFHNPFVLCMCTRLEWSLKSAEVMYTSCPSVGRQPPNAWFEKFFFLKVNKLREEKIVTASCVCSHFIWPPVALLHCGCNLSLACMLDFAF